MLWASASGKTFQDKDHNPTMDRWIEKVLKTNKKEKQSEKITKQDVKNRFQILKK